jgi:hypothetical protein
MMGGPVDVIDRTCFNTRVGNSGLAQEFKLILVAPSEFEDAIEEVFFRKVDLFINEEVIQEFNIIQNL